MRRIAAAAGAAVVMTLVAPAAVAAWMPTLSPESLPSDVVPVDVGELVTASLSDFTTAAIEKGDSLDASVTVTNGSMLLVENVVMRVSLTRAPLSTDDALEEFLDNPTSHALRFVAQEPQPTEESDAADEGSDAGSDGDGADSADGEQDGEAEVGISIGPRSTTSIGMSVNATDLGLPEDSWGVYGAVIELVAGDTSAVVDALPITWAAADVPELTTSVLASTTGADSRVDTVLTASNVEGVTVAVDPTMVSNALVFEHDLTQRDVLRVPAGSPDLTSLAHADDDVLLPAALSQPSSTVLGSFGSADWISVPAVVDGETVALAHSNGAVATVAIAGVPGYEALLEADSTVLAAGKSQAPVLVANDILSTSLESYRPGTVAASAVLVAKSALVAEDQAGEPTLVVAGPSWQIGGTGTSAALEALVAAPWVSVIPVTELLDRDATAVSVEQTLDTDNDLPASHIEALSERIGLLATLATATDRPDTTATEWNAPIVKAVPVTLRGDSPARDVAVSEAVLAADDVLGGVRIAASSDLNLLADSGDIPVTVVNTTDKDMTVRVILSSSSPSLRVRENPLITVPAGQEAVAPVTVDAVSSANVTVTATLRTPTGAMISEVRTFDVRVRADWGTAATAVFSVLLVMLMVAGLVRTIRRGRKDTRDEPSPAPATAPTIHELGAGESAEKDTTSDGRDD
ncbi:DUF6049 family protein [Demequina sp.]|uniref:DUF6049 family protein n=1 Tax=Demequina sp. TaxID=2050685 RepID=UPI003A8BEA88